MLTSARKTMPAIDYVSIVRSVYGDRRALLFGALASASAAAVSAYRAQSIALTVVAVAFVLVGVARYLNMVAFWKAAIEDEDDAAAERWENRALLGGCMVAITYGAWCLISILFVDDPFAEFASATLGIAAMVGCVARNFGLDRLVTLQTLCLTIPFSIALILKGGFSYPFLAVLLVMLLVSFRDLAGGIRSILLAAVHGRVEASQLAADLDISLATMNHGVLMLDASNAVSVSNQRAVEFFDRFGAKISTGQPFEDVVEALGGDETLPRTTIDRLTDLVSRNGDGKVLLALSEGRYFEVTVSSRRRNSVLLFEDISERVEAEERINHLARHDALTGLPNRIYFAEYVNEALEDRRSSVLQGVEPTSTALFMIDIDDFKHVNDSMGHMVGDRLLREVASRVRKALPPQCMLARLAGDEFVVFVSQIGSHDAAEELAKMLLSTFDRPFNLGSASPLVSTSIGIVVSDRLMDDLDNLLARADLALYAAKAEGKHGAKLFHADMDINYQHRQRLKFDLSQAVADQDLSLAFQPLIDLSTGKVVSCEALVRWTHPSLGVIPPSTFIPLAEEMGLISAITNLVLRQATRECSRWPAHIGVAVNISARDFRSGDVHQMVNRSLAEAGLAANRLELEVTETALIEHRESAIESLKAFAAQGIGISLDDFGTGYSSLSYLQALPFTKLKIDRSFLSDIVTDRRARNLLTNVARIGTDLNMCVLAEGVETEEQLQVLRDHSRVQQAQGYLFSRPLPARDVADFIRHFEAASRGEGEANLLHG
ncbi:diguanylate cyclase [Devosia pacifica]|uniref:Diguanylate cyclase n=1 Tax=Devosia pacifica TaxID=1335967 RepID=A0A918S4R9_9HYPH|nr:EAL domain-containing protein [Devosia pacifica]GHA24053.1 diguanylate cyclase [Devosia pacifica]